MTVMNCVYSNNLVTSALASFLAITCANAQVPQPGDDATPAFNNQI